MERQRIRLDDYNWDIDIFYDATKVDVDEIMEYLYHIGCDGDIAKQAYENLSSGKLNTGLTFSKNNKSCIVLGRTSDRENFSHTFSHEICHLGHHIANAYNFSAYGEKLAYLIGDISAIMLPYASKYLCDCCSTKNKPKNNIKDYNKGSQFSLLMKIIDEHSKLSSGEIRLMLYDAIDLLE